MIRFAVEVAAFEEACLHTAESIEIVHAIRANLLTGYE